MKVETVMNARPKFYQRQFFIKKDFQAKFILLYLLSVLLVVGLSNICIRRI